MKAEEILKGQNIQIEKLKQEKPLLVHCIFKAMDEYGNLRFEDGRKESKEGIETLIEDYQRRLATANEMLESELSTTIKSQRLNVKASTYRTLISELQKLIQ